MLTGEILIGKAKDNPVPSSYCISNLNIININSLFNAQLVKPSTLVRYNQSIQYEKVQRLAQGSVEWVLFHSKCETPFLINIMVKI